MVGLPDAGKLWKTMENKGKTMENQSKTKSINHPNPMNSESNCEISKNVHEIALKALPASVEFPQKPVLKGSFHQGDARFGDSRNRQCGAVSLTAVLTSKMKNVLTWSTRDLDGVLVAGTQLYETLRNQGNINDQEAMGRHYIAVHELPRRHVLGNTVFYIEYTDSLTGLVNVDVYDEAVSSVVMPLDVALQQTLLSADAFLLTISANTCAVIKQGSWYAFVDSHAVKTETSYVAYHSSIQSLYNYINEIAMSFGVNEPLFEITGVMVHTDADDSQLLEADNSSLPCSSSKVLYSEIVKRTPKHRDQDYVCAGACDNGTSNETAKCKLWICPTCHRKILYGQLPAESVANNMHLVDIPFQLKCLNSLEQHLVARNIPFLKLLCLPRGKQRGCHGPVVCVPVNASDICNILPRNECDDMMVRIKLKRKLTYKGHYEYKYVHTDRVRNALKYLIRCNRWYKDVEINEWWVNSLDEPPENVVCDEMQEQTAEAENGNGQKDPEEETEEDLTYIKEQCGLLSDTSLQPVDVGCEIIDQHFQDVLNVAPAEGKSPVKLLSDKTNEAKCFPVLFPTGGPTFHDDREVKITLSRYLNARILNADGRFAQNTDFIFYAQYLSELDQIVSNVSIALRKGSDKSLLQAVTSDVLTNPESLTKLLNYDEGYKFLRPVRGTPPYWQATQKDIFALIRQLGIPTFFASFSSADLRWPEMIKTILIQEGKNLNVDELDWSEKCGLIRRNPVTAARMFDHRWHCFLKDVIMSPAQPIGKVIDYFYRVEFQQRGSPHVHCLFWVENAPKLNEDNEDNDALVAAFVDRYITCEIPSEDDSELYETVNSVQKHSIRHSKTCRKKNTVCRFNFPRPPSGRTFISRAYLGQCNDENETASAVLKKIKSALTDFDVSFVSTDALFQSIGIDQAVFEKAYKKCSKKKSVVLKRNPNDVWVNQYNKHLIRAWHGNMDIQYVTDAYSVVVYIISYITKAEQEIGLLLQRAQNEALDGNHEARSALKRLGSIYLHNREISSQEAVYRLTGMHLKECSRKVQFIPIGTDPVKMSLPLHVLQAEQSGEKSTIWMKSLVDRYKSRPKTQNFDVMCIASFCSEYRILSQSEISSQKSSKDKVIKLNNNCGYMIRRSRTKPAVVRYPRFSPTKDPEKYHHSLLQLFLPHYEDWQLKPDNFNTYEDFYNHGAVKCGSSLASVKCTVDANRAVFEKESDKINRAQQLLEQGVDLEDAWALLCPETEKERDECLNLKKQRVLPDEDDSGTLIPDLAANAQTAFTIDTSNVTMSRDEALSLLRSLNAEQSAVFHKVRKWCLQKVYGENSEPFFLFVTGGAGTGKSHLIKAIHYESCRLLSQLSDNPDDRTVILCASTGVAAYNIGAATIHNTFSIGVNVKLPYQPLSDDKINSLRSKMACLQILIIDEISMVDHHLLSYVHGRLRQIKQTGDYSVFGKVSIIAVGDFYQLPPVKGTPLYADAKGVNLWDNIFEIAELTNVVRQEDASFAEMLNRVRVRKKKESLSLSDINMLKQCETGEVCTDIHIFPTNSEVDEYNMLMLHECCPDVISIRARDFVRNPKTGRMEPKVGMHTKVFNSCLSTFVSLGVGARVMLKKNVDVSDGLVNGAFGTVVHISESQKHDDDNDNDFPSAIHVVFDDPNVGKVQRLNQQPRFSKNATVIEAQEDHVTNDGGIRRQFPLKLAWACTVHKVQGLTVDKAVVSLDKIFAPGQAYVALSRVRTIDGLIIQNFKESAIYCNNKIEQAMKNMVKFSLENNGFRNTPGIFRIALHNVQSLQAHIQDVRAHRQLLNADCICLTETWLKAEDKEDEVQIPGFNFKHNPRANCYDNSSLLFSNLKHQRGGGVGIYCCQNVVSNVIIPEPCNLECLYLTIPHVNLNVALLYRPNSYPIDMFRLNVSHVIAELEKHAGTKLIMGDFNEDIITSSTIRMLMEFNGYSQHVQHPTTEKRTLIDHVYAKDVQNISVEISSTYYSYHEAVLVTVW
ncbi:LOW QUALITY PROTEIN: uncharacterized protein [Misgurnus anguillicaudatus]|uniref:LOW QUALITY PROTEIN: uncharacterized protein n=1 Tax=Misgurnus anguillicaudatus TaxID=75329 RepID=UPI003CCFD72C